MGSKLWIVLAFLLSVAAAGGSYFLYQGMTQERGRREGVEAKYDQVKEKMLVVQSEKEQTNTEKEKYKAESEEYRARAQAMQGQIDKLQNDQSKNKEAQETLEKQISSYQTTMEELQKKVLELDKKAKDAQQACMAKPEDLLPAAQPFGSPAPVSGATAEAVPGGSSDLTFTSSISTPPPTETQTISPDPSSIVKTAVESPASAETTSAVTPPEVPKGSKVLTINRKFNFVVVNQGIQDGLKMGDRLTVINQGKDGAKLQVEKLYDKFCAATILEENSKHQVAEGDDVRRD